MVAGHISYSRPWHKPSLSLDVVILYTMINTFKIEDDSSRVGKMIQSGARFCTTILYLISVPTYLYILKFLFFCRNPFNNGLL